MSAEVLGIRLRGLVLVALSRIGSGSARDIADRIASDFGYQPEDYWRATGDLIEEALFDLKSTRWAPGCDNRGVWRLPKPAS